MALFDSLKPPVILHADDSISKAVSELKRDSEACLVIVKDKMYQGIIDDRCIANFTGDSANAKTSSLLVRAPLIKSDSTLLEVCKSFFTGPYRSLPVDDNGRISGILTRNAVIKALSETGVLQGVVQDFMSAPAVATDSNTTLAQARAKMRERNVPRLVIVDGDKMVGLLSTYDLKMATSKPREKSGFVGEKVTGEKQSVSSLMRVYEEVALIGPSASLHEAAQKMIERDLGSLIVVESGKALGVLSARDIFESIMQKPPAAIEISGLAHEDREYIEDIKSEAETELEKLQKSFTIDYLALHFKKYGHKHSVHARLKTTQGVISVSNFGFDLGGVVHGAMKEFHTILMEKKKMHDPMHMKKKKPSAS